MKSLFEVAIEAARPDKADKRLFTLGAVAIRQDGKWIVSHNGSSSHPVYEAHAEARCLRKAGRGATLIVARVRKDGTLGLAKPCRRCQALIKSKEVHAVYYSTNENTFERL